MRTTLVRELVLLWICASGFHAQSLHGSAASALDALSRPRAARFQMYVRRITASKGVYVLRHHIQDALARLEALPPNVRRQDDIVEL